MKTSTLIIILVIAFIIIGSAFLLIKNNNSGINQKNPNVPINNLKILSISGFAFNPSELIIKKGETVTWTNEDPVSHSVTSDSGAELDSQTLSKGDSYSHKFDQTGTINYHCKFHPSMKAKIVVE